MNDDTVIVVGRNDLCRQYQELLPEEIRSGHIRAVVHSPLRIHNAHAVVLFDETKGGYAIKHVAGRLGWLRDKVCLYYEGDGPVTEWSVCDECLAVMSDKKLSYQEVYPPDVECEMCGVIPLDEMMVSTGQGSVWVDEPA